MAEQGVRIEDRGAVRIITIDRERRSNALDVAASEAIDQAVDAAERDPAIRVVLLTAAGERSFCAGMDLKEAAERGPGHGLVPGRGFAGITERRRTKPLIVAANGAVVAGGFELALAADIVIAADHAIFGLAEVKRGLFAFAGGVQRLARSVPRATALHIVLTGEPIGAARALELGLISEVVPRDRLMPRAIELAETIAGFDRDTVRRALALHDFAADAPIAESLSFGRAYGEETLGGLATQEGIRAYAEGRAE
ncbi:MAG: enoyl-CoA hydratase/isomerase family protein [Pseudomonadota bacterium]|uniref:enoyl-CoA hydratase/isomerase family protein n=1 Tax=Rhizorhabdus phycosphaerae TaxID=2711156 RepID=UPI0013EA2FF4|nr:enoyl-CoA hydratase-related protein [Rhizorhabdus phycosphaerae]